MTAVQMAEMRRVDLALDRLQVVAVALDHADVDLVVRRVEDLQAGSGGASARAHVDPDQPGALDRAVGIGPHLLLEVLFRRHARHVDALSRYVNSSRDRGGVCHLLVASQEQRGAAMRTAVVHDTDAAVAVAKAISLSPSSIKRTDRHRARARRISAPGSSIRASAGPSACQGRTGEFRAFGRGCHLRSGCPPRIRPPPPWSALAQRKGMSRRCAPRTCPDL